MAPADQSITRPDLAGKDAIYLFELMRDSPQPILLHIGPYAERTGAKPNSIIKQLSIIKKRHGLNIITTTSAPGGGSGSHPTPRARPSAARNTAAGADVKPKIKRERASAKTTKTSAPAPTVSTKKNSVEVEKNEEEDEPEPLSPPAAGPLGLPSPADSSLDTPLSNWPKGRSKSALSNTANPGFGMQAAQMPLFMPQKRAREDADESCHATDDGNVMKKLKTETTWGFS